MGPQVRKEPDARCLWTFDDASTLRAVVAGSLNFDSVPGLWKWVTDALGCGARRVCLDLELVTDMDTAGVAFLVEVLRVARERGADVTLVNAGSEVREMLELFGLKGLGAPVASAPGRGAG